MKITTIILIFFTFISNAQQNSEKAKEFLETLNSDKIISENYNKFKNRILESTTLVFNDYNLDITNNDNLKEFTDFINRNIEFFKQDAKDRTLLIYSNYDIERLEKFIHLTKTEPDFKTVLRETNYAKIFDNIIKEHSVYIAEDIPLIVKNIKANSEPLRLRLIIDNDTIPNMDEIDLTLELVTENENYKKLEILNKQTTEIEIPKDLKYEEMKYVILTYNNEEHNFFENHYENLPKELRAVMSEEVKEMHNPLSKYCFEELLYWEIIIDNDPNNNPDFELIKNPQDPKKEVKSLISLKTRNKSIIRIK